MARPGNAARAPTSCGPRKPSAAGAPVDYTIAIEPTDRRWLPALDLATLAPHGAHFTATRELVSDSPVSQAREYRVRSSTRYTLASTLAPRERERALALPDGFDPRTRVLADSWRKAGRNDDAVVRSALDLFHASFTYTLSPPLLGRDSVDEFLFETQKGFCEHYASAFVFLMRAAGIPRARRHGLPGRLVEPDRQLSPRAQLRRACVGRNLDRGPRLGAPSIRPPP